MTRSAHVTLPEVGSVFASATDLAKALEPYFIAILSMEIDPLSMQSARVWTPKWTALCKFCDIMREWPIGNVQKNNRSNALVPKLVWSQDNF